MRDRLLSTRPSLLVDLSSFLQCQSATGSDVLPKSINNALWASRVCRWRGQPGTRQKKARRASAQSAQTATLHATYTHLKLGHIWNRHVSWSNYISCMPYVYGNRFRSGAFAYVISTIGRYSTVHTVQKSDDDEFISPQGRCLCHIILYISTIPFLFCPNVSPESFTYFLVCPHREGIGAPRKELARYTKIVTR